MEYRENKQQMMGGFFLTKDKKFIILKTYLLRHVKITFSPVMIMGKMKMIVWRDI